MADDHSPTAATIRYTGSSGVFSGVSATKQASQGMSETWQVTLPLKAIPKPVDHFQLIGDRDRRKRTVTTVTPLSGNAFDITCSLPGA